MEAGGGGGGFGTALDGNGWGEEKKGGRLEDVKEMKCDTSCFFLGFYMFRAHYIRFLQIKQTLTQPMANL